MFNAGYKKEVLAKLERKDNEYNDVINEMVKNAEILHKEKETSNIILKEVEDYLKSLHNVPIKYQQILSEITIRRRKFENEVENIRRESEKFDKINAGATGAGVVAGAGVAALGPTAAMAIATTFGTASTGTAIATLSGAAATNAALAWLGGGTLLAGGGGMAAGETFLAMAGPVGWAIGGAALLGGGLMANSKNKKIAEEAEAKINEINDSIGKEKNRNSEILAEMQMIYSLYGGIDRLLKRLKSLPYRDYDWFSDDEASMLGQLINLSETLSERIGAKFE